MIVVSDTSVINYLIEIGHIEILNRLYHGVLIPQAVLHELSADGAPAKVRDWIKAPPKWLSVKSVTPDPSIHDLGRGETEAITLALQEHCILLLDEHAGRTIARALGVKVIGVIGILQQAAYDEYLDFDAAVGALQQSGFFVSDALIAHVKEDLQNDLKNKKR